MKKYAIKFLRALLFIAMYALLGIVDTITNAIIIMAIIILFDILGDILIKKLASKKENI